MSKRMGGSEMTTRIIFIVMFAICSTASALAQSETPLSPRTGPTPEPIEPVDDSYLPDIASRVNSLRVVSIRREDPFIHIELKNVGEKSICSLRFAYHKNGQSVMLNFVVGEKPCIGPGEVYVEEYPFAPRSIFARQPVTFEAVLFEDGSGDGDAAKVKSLQDVFLRNRKELEHVIAVLKAAMDEPEVELVTHLVVLQEELSQTPDYMYGVEPNNIAGITLPSWKATAMRMIEEIQKTKFEGSPDSIKESLSKINRDFEKTLAKYPRQN